MEKKIVTLYQTFVRHTTGNFLFYYSPTQRDKATITKFIATFADGIDDDLLFDFFSFQFFRYHDLETEFSRVMLNWVIGAKAITKWNAKSEEHLFMSKEFSYKNGIMNPFKDSKPISPRDVSKCFGNNKYHNMERKRFYGSNRGFIHCKENALYNPDLDVCIECKNFKDCENVGKV